MQPSVMALVLQGTLVSSSNSSHSGSRARTGMGTGTGMDVSNGDRNNITRMCRQGRTASNGRVKARDRHRQMDVSDKETDSVRWRYRTGMDNIRRNHRTGTGIARRASPRQRNRGNRENGGNRGNRGKGGNRGNRGNRDEVDIPNRVKEVA